MVSDRRGGLVIKERQVDGWVLMNIEGILFDRSVPTFCDSVEVWIERGLCNFILIFELNSRLEAAGMDGIIAVFDRIKHCKGQLIIADVDEHLNRLRLSGFTKFMQIVRSEKEALKLVGLV